MKDMLDTWVTSLVPPAVDLTVASTRRGHIIGCLNTSDMPVVSMFESGSWSHGTGIRDKSDVDYMVQLRTPHPALPSTTLHAVRRVLLGRRRPVVSARVSAPVVSVEFASSPMFELVPCYFKAMDSGFETHWIPGPNDQWVVSAPKAHLEYVNRQNDRLGKRVKPLIRLLKSWKHHVSLPASSFYLEMRTASHASTQSSILLIHDLRMVIARLQDEGFRDMNDPMGIVGRIPACSSEERRVASVRKAREAHANLNVAFAGLESGDKHAYWASMYDVFGKDFPWPRD